MRRFAVLGVVFAASCGTSDGMQMCGADHCGLQGHTIVKWQLDHYPEWSFPFDSCSDFGVNKVHVDAVDAAGTVTSTQDDCGAGQVTFDGLPEGNYTVYVAPRDFGGGDLVTFPPSAMAVAGTYGNDTTTNINVPYTSWIGTYTGTYLFRLSWGGVTCASAPTPVVTQTVKLSVNGSVVNAMADNGQWLDGADPKPCYALEENFPQSATQIPFGPAKLTIEGRDASSTVVYTHDFDTFVGAGITNPTITYDVPTM